ncbi:hypothetical protein PLESTF_001978400 [Pleodorina starrii]|nr:hypothetical protein PLESTF_001978400 [Pleodorina starrii]
MNAAVFDRTEYNPLAPEGDPGTHVYRLVRYTAQRTNPIKLRIHNSSVLWRSTPSCIVYSTVQQADNGWYEMQGVTAVQPAWLIELAPHMFHKPGPA